MRKLGAEDEPRLTVGERGHYNRVGGHESDDGGDFGAVRWRDDLRNRAGGQHCSACLRSRSPVDLTHDGHAQPLGPSARAAAQDWVQPVRFGGRATALTGTGHSSYVQASGRCAS